jgi:HAD superfamily hydrolase (TIGR01549 family)
VRVDAVTFDYWNTLVHEQPGHLRARRIAAWLGLLEEAAIPVTSEALHELFDRSWEAFVEAWRANRQLRAPEAAALMLAELGHEVPPALHDAMVEAFVAVGHDAELQLVDGVVEVLAALDEAGVRLGIICDVGMTPSTTLRDHLERHGVLSHFDHWSFSDEVGVYKPDPRIFEHAYEGLGRPDPRSTVHVGDLRRTDVAGARAAGWVSVRFRGVLDDDDAEVADADHVIDGHRELLAALAG